MPVVTIRKRTRIEDNFLTDNFSKGFQIHRRNLDNHQPPVSAIFYACNVGERAYEWPDKGHGVFVIICYKD